MERDFYEDLENATLVPASDYMPVMEVDPGDAMIYTWGK
jgi:hypothetical protein